MNQGFTVWLTGLSGAGKSTIAERLAPELSARGCSVEVLDGDEVRTHLSKGLGFSREDRDINIGRISFVASLLVRHGAAVITAAISPYAQARAEARQRIGSARFVEVFVRCSLDELVRRDVKGLYKKAIAGEIAALHRRFRSVRSSGQSGRRRGQRNRNCRRERRENSCGAREARLSCMPT